MSKICYNHHHHLINTDQYNICVLTTAKCNKQLSISLKLEFKTQFQTHIDTHNCFTAMWILSGTTRVSRYQKKHAPTHPSWSSNIPICLLHLLRSKPRGRPKKTWREIVLNRQDATDCNTWKKQIRDDWWPWQVWVGECFFCYWRESHKTVVVVAPSDKVTALLLLSEVIVTLL